MKQILGCFLLFLTFSTTLFADIPKQIIFFGDSLTDNGNLYHGFFKLMPKSPPYYDGRFSNGPTWAESMAQYYLTKYNTSSLNYAVGGATVVLRNPFKKNLPYDLLDELGKYQLSHLFSAKDQTLFVIWMGANDYLNGADNVDQITTQVVNKLSDVMTKLINNGGRHFLILNLPDLSKTPYAQNVTPQQKQNLHDLTISHNEKLAVAIQQLKNAYKGDDFTLIDVGSIFDDMINDPEKYNQKYNMHIKNIADACWAGGYTAPKNNYAQLNVALKKLLLEHHVRDTNAVAAVMNSPAISEAYRVASAYDAGQDPCANPDDYIFWDHVHPTRVVHQVFSIIVIADLLNSSDSAISRV